jgi:uncharacterized protein YprB with RNaseH-like and TPR domain
MTSPGPLERTFQLHRGIGPWRERDLWARGIDGWGSFLRAARQGVVMSAKLDPVLVEAIELARKALHEGNLEALAALLPAREQWRLYPHFGEQAAFIDIEADGEQQITVIGVFDSQGPATFIRGRNLAEAVPRLQRSALWVTFNGAVFDVPVLKRHFPHLQVAPAHVDLRFLCRKLKLKGGLKTLEKMLGLTRPSHLEGVNGFEAIRLWREYGVNRRLDALRVLVEYNLYDCINLKTLLEHSIARLSEQLVWDEARRPIFERGEVLYDVSRLLLSLDG